MYSTFSPFFLYTIFSFRFVSLLRTCTEWHQLPGSPVVYVLGTLTEMEEDTQERVKKLFSHGIAVAASVSDAVIIDGGLNAHLSAAETTAAETTTTTAVPGRKLV